MQFEIMKGQTVANKLNNICIALLLIAAGIFCSGCGLKYPDIKEFPCKRFRTVVVKDYETKNIIENAKVEFAISKWENWMSPYVFSLPKLSESNTSKKSESPKVSDEKKYGLELLKSKYVGNGTYTIESKTKCGWIQNFFPIITPLGWTLYDTYIGSLNIRAPGYMNISIPDDNGHWLRNEEPIAVYEIFHHNPVKGTFIILKKDHVEILLPKTGTIPLQKLNCGLAPEKTE